MRMFMCMCMCMCMCMYMNMNMHVHKLLAGHTKQGALLPEVACYMHG
jgi:hypothetical protein